MNHNLIIGMQDQARLPRVRCRYRDLHLSMDAKVIQRRS